MWKMVSTNGRCFYLVEVERSSCGRVSLVTIGGPHLWQMVSINGGGGGGGVVVESSSCGRDSLENGWRSPGVADSLY